MLVTLAAIRRMLSRTEVRHRHGVLLTVLPSPTVLCLTNINLSCTCRDICSGPATAEDPSLQHPLECTDGDETVASAAHDAHLCFCW